MKYAKFLRTLFYRKLRKTGSGVKNRTSTSVKKVADHLKRNIYAVT